MGCAKSGSSVSAQTNCFLSLSHKGRRLGGIAMGEDVLTVGEWHSLNVCVAPVAREPVLGLSHGTAIPLPCSNLGGSAAGGFFFMLNVRVNCHCSLKANFDGPP